MKILEILPNLTLGLSFLPENLEKLLSRDDMNSLSNIPRNLRHHYRRRTEGQELLGTSYKDDRGRAVSCLIREWKVELEYQVSGSKILLLQRS